MKIGLVLDRFDPAAGGRERWVAGFAQFLETRSHSPYVLAFEAIPDPGVPVQLMPAAGDVLARAKTAAITVAELGADVVLDTGTSWSGDVFMPCTGSRRWTERQLARGLAWPQRLRAAISPRSRAHDRALAQLEREQVERARHVIAVSTLVRDLLIEQHGLAPERISVVPNGIETGRLTPSRIAALRQPRRAALGLRDEVLFLGSAHDMWLKGMDTAIAALAGLGANAHLVIAGATPDVHWRHLADAAFGRVHFLGQVDDMAPVFAAADALIHPTRWDACSLSTIEAGAAGLPVVTSVRNGAADLISEGETGFILPDPENRIALADRMRRLLDPTLRRRMGAAALAASQRHGALANYEAVLAILTANRRSDEIDREVRWDGGSN